MLHIGHMRLIDKCGLYIYIYIYIYIHIFFLFKLSWCGLYSGALNSLNITVICIRFPNCVCVFVCVCLQNCNFKLLNYLCISDDIDVCIVVAVQDEGLKMAAVLGGGLKSVAALGEGLADALPSLLPPRFCWMSVIRFLAKLSTSFSGPGL